MMTDLYDPTGPIGDASLDDMALYSEIPADPSSTHDSAVDIGQNFAFEAHQMSNEHLEDVMLSSEGFTSNYIPHSSEVDINNMQAYNSYDDNAQVSFSAPQHGGHPLAWHAPSSAPPSPATMTEFFQMMSQPENVQAYMHFLQTQHEQAPQAPAPPPPLRSRSNSNPTSSSLPSAFSLRPSSTEAPFEASARDKKLAKYRTKRARRLTGSQISNSEPSPAPALAAATEGVEGERFMPAPKIQKTLAHDLENRLHTSEEEVKMLRSALEYSDLERRMLRHALYEEQHQYQQWAMQFGEASSNASSSAATSPRPHSPSTPAMVSSPSSISLGSSTMDADFMSLDTSSLGSDHVMEVMAANQRRQEKLKQLGGPPSDVYHPWWNGIPLNHPAFSLKEDWQHFELRPQERLAHERLNYIVMQQRHRAEQSSLSGSPTHSEMGQVPPHFPMDVAGNGHPNIHSPSPSFYQSPHHHSHIMTGSPAQGSGYWGGHFAPAGAEKVDFSKISLRKTSTGEMPTSPMGGVSPMSGPMSGPMSVHGPPPAMSSGSRFAFGVPSSSKPLSSPQGSHMPMSPSQAQESPTAAIWRDAMAHPEMHRLPSRWLQEQGPAPQQSQRAPFRRAASSSTTNMSNNAMNFKQLTPPSPQQQLLQQQLQQQLHNHMQQHNMRYSPTNVATPTSPLSAQNAARRLQSPSSN